MLIDRRVRVNYVVTPIPFIRPNVIDSIVYLTIDDYFLKQVGGSLKVSLKL